MPHPKKSNNKSKSKTREEYKIEGEELIEKVKKVIREGNVRRMIVKNEKGETMLEIPVTFAVLGVALAPILAAVGALAALLTNATLIVERKK